MCFSEDRINANNFENSSGTLSANEGAFREENSRIKCQIANIRLNGIDRRPRFNATENAIHEKYCLIFRSGFQLRGTRYEVNLNYSGKITKFVSNYKYDSIFSGIYAKLSIRCDNQFLSRSTCLAINLLEQTFLRQFTYDFSPRSIVGAYGKRFEYGISLGHWTRSLQCRFKLLM